MRLQPALDLGVSVLGIPVERAYTAQHEPVQEPRHNVVQRSVVGASGQRPGFAVPIFNEFLLREDNPFLLDRRDAYYGVSLKSVFSKDGRRETWQSHLWTHNKKIQVYLGQYPKPYLAAYARDCAYLFLRDLQVSNECKDLTKRENCGAEVGVGTSRRKREKRTNFPPEIYAGVLLKLKEEYASTFDDSDYDIKQLAKLMRKCFVKVFRPSGLRYNLD